MARVYVSPNTDVLYIVNLDILPDVFELAEQDDHWSKRTLLEFDGCDVIVLQLRPSPHSLRYGQVVDVTMGIYDGLFGWQARRFHLDPDIVCGEKTLLDACHRQAAILRNNIQYHYEEGPYRPWLVDNYAPPL